MVGPHFLKTCFTCFVRSNFLHLLRVTLHSSVWFCPLYEVGKPCAPWASCFVLPVCVNPQETQVALLIRCEIFLFGEELGIIYTQQQTKG